jgi:putative mRNA 3-end processing factor
MALVEFRKEGIYVPMADVYIDPWQRVSRALITHGHSDHARWGHKQYLCTVASKPILRHRLGDVQIDTLNFGEEISINGIKFSFHPAGHIVGSAQIRIEYRGEVWVVSGDYKVEDDGISGTFAPIRCHTFITECTFGLPIYSWLPQHEVLDQINRWWAGNSAAKVTSLITAYSLGKSQRVLAGLDPSIGPIYTHGAVHNMNSVLTTAGLVLPASQHLNDGVSKGDVANAIVIAPGGATNSEWMRRFKDVSIANASGWMQLRGPRRRGAADRGFALSDHADWQGLNDAIRATGANRIYATHGYTDIFQKWLLEQGYDAHIVQTKFEGEQNETAGGSADIEEK